MVAPSSVGAMTQLKLVQSGMGKGHAQQSPLLGHCVYMHQPLLPSMPPNSYLGLCSQGTSS